ncbi:MAG: hypothetical protein A2Y33_01725 [Spirochaetes bacterium GWF1_51_8]|nr:MAG: hypothetical protein A2Y33_01725 [Spirochaetes bacterium GWF1_51_8]
MNAEFASYIVGASFGLFLCVQYIAFYFILSRNTDAKKNKSDVVYIALIGVSILLYGIFGCLQMMNTDPYLQSLFYKLKLSSGILLLLFYVLLLRFILILIKDMTFVETDEYKESTRKYVLLMIGVNTLMIILVMFTDLIISHEKPEYNLTGLVFPAFFVIIAVVEYIEFVTLMKKEEGKISPMNKIRFKTILWTGTVPVILALAEILIRVFVGPETTTSYGSFFMYGIFFLSLGLSLNLMFEYMGVLSRMSESNRKMSELNKKMLDEVRTAQSLQFSLLPIDKQREIQKLLDMEISYMPMQSVGGDYYDFYQIDDRKLLMILGDASGHGIYAAMIWAMLKVEVEEIIEENQISDLAQAFTLLNKRITRILENTYSYATLFSCLIDLNSHSLTYISAGHTDQFYFSKRDQSVVKIRNRNPIIGTFKNAKYNADGISNQPGDAILLFTDGVSDAINPEGIPIGEQRLEDMFLEACQNADTASLILNNMLSSIEEFCEGTIQHDDRTMMVIKL